MVPGLFIAQHQGGGKADQIFLRGFDADHGTDVAVFIDGIPVTDTERHEILTAVALTPEVVRDVHAPNLDARARAALEADPARHR